MRCMRHETNRPSAPPKLDLTWALCWSLCASSRPLAAWRFLSEQKTQSLNAEVDWLVVSTSEKYESQLGYVGMIVLNTWKNNQKNNTKIHQTVDLGCIIFKELLDFDEHIEQCYMTPMTKVTQL